jgi:SAM-dependent methyltransferase
MGAERATGGPPDAGAASLDVAAGHYFWKPLLALFRAVELEVYRRAEVRLDPPILDLGCGDARLLRMLEECGVAQGAAVGLDYSLAELGKACDVPAHLGLVRADARRLPFAGGRFRSIVCNGVLGGIEHGMETVLAEIHRVLRPQGTLAATMPTDGFIEVQLVPRLMGAISTANRERIPHFHYLSAEAWTARLERAGLEVVRREEYFSPALGRPWSLLFLPPCRLFGALRWIGRGPLRGPFARGAGAILRPAVRREERALREGQATPRGYVLLVARRP